MGLIFPDVNHNAESKPTAQSEWRSPLIDEDLWRPLARSGISFGDVRSLMGDGFAPKCHAGVQAINANEWAAAFLFEPLFGRFSNAPWYLLLSYGISKDEVVGHITSNNEQCRTIGVDRFESMALARSLSPYVNVLGVGQGYRSHTNPLNAFRRLMYSKRITHCCNSFATASLLSTEVASNKDNNFKISGSTKHTAAARAMINAFAIVEGSN